MCDASRFVRANWDRLLRNILLRLYTDHVAGRTAPITWETQGAPHRLIPDVAVRARPSAQQKMMRHADIRTTMNIYGDVATEEEPETAMRVARIAFQ